MIFACRGSSVSVSSIRGVCNGVSVGAVEGQVKASHCNGLQQKIRAGGQGALAKENRPRAERKNRRIAAHLRLLAQRHIPGFRPRDPGDHPRAGLIAIPIEREIELACERRGFCCRQVIVSDAGTEEPLRFRCVRDRRAVAMPRAALAAVLIAGLLALGAAGAVHLKNLSTPAAVDRLPVRPAAHEVFAQPAARSSTREAAR